MTKARLEAFSDGVIAIIITIMVLELKVPHSVEWAELQKLWPQFVSYIFSFAAVGIYWANHHHLVHTIKTVSSGIMWANLHLLFWLSLIPFATAWLGESRFAQNPLIVYCVLANLCGLSYYILLTAIKKCNSHNPELEEIMKKQSKKGLQSNFIYLAGIAAVFIHPAISGFCIVLVAIMWFIPDRNIEKAAHSK